MEKEIPFSAALHKTTPTEVLELVKRYEDNRDSCLADHYKEAHIRHEFIDPLFKLLGWDVNNERGYADAYKEVIHEDAIKIGSYTKAPDYCFRIGGTRKFFVEAKKPKLDLQTDTESAYQLRRYAWSAKLPLSLLTNFEQLAVYDCRIRPTNGDNASVGRMLFFSYRDFLADWDKIDSVFSHEAVLKGSFDRYAESAKIKKGTSAVDDSFLREIEDWRDRLAHNIALRNRNLSENELNFAVQATINRIVFLRICEDRGSEEYGRLMALLNGENIYPRLKEMFQRADERYNSGLFHFHEEKDRYETPDLLTSRLRIDDKLLQDIIRHLYYPDSPYEFSVLSADILGQVYEQFLGKVIRLTENHQAKIEDKPEVKKAGGVYYTPTYIVDYIVKDTLGNLLSQKTPKQVSKMRVLDPSCGSGSFLLSAYQSLLDWHLAQYIKEGPDSHKNEMYQGMGGVWRLGSKERKRILLNNIYGVDIDAQAVEVTKLSLLLKVLEGETDQSIRQQLEMFHERALPDLAENIKCGNSLISADFYDQKNGDLFGESKSRKVNVFSWEKEFEDIMVPGGFDVIIGNPPYLKIEHIDNEDRAYYSEHYSSVMKRFDTFGLFIEKSLALAKRTGQIGMIIPSTMLNNSSFSQLRKLLLDKATIHKIVNLGGRIFRGANNDTLIVIFSKERQSGTKAEIMDVVNYGAGLNFAELTGQINFTQKAQAPGYEFELRMSDSTNLLLTGMSEKSLRLGDICSCFQGFVTGGNEAYLVDEKTIVQEKLERNACKEAVFGDDVGRYVQPTSETSVIYLTRDFDITTTPRIKAHLEPFKQKLELKRETRNGRQPWYALHWARSQENFERSPKILVQAIRNLALNKRIVATMDNNRLYADHTLNVLYTNRPDYDLKFVLGVINSRLINFIFSKKYIDINIKGVYLSAIPIPRIDFSDSKSTAQHNKLVTLVEQIMDQNVLLKQTKIPAHETRIKREIEITDDLIDRLVYQLFDLNLQQIALIK